MKKGERRRADILRVAEEQFYARGYEATTIQDILDILTLSKGGFYHHFASKDQLLEALCEAKVLVFAQRGREMAGEAFGGAVDRLNSLLSGSCLWRADSADFAGLFIRIAYQDDNSIMRERFKQLMAQALIPSLEEILTEGIASGEFSAQPEMARLATTLLGGLTDDIARSMLGENPPAAAEMLRLLDLYRKALEGMLSAPYGTVVIYPMGDLVSACQLIWQKHRRAAAQPPLQAM